MFGPLLAAAVFGASTFVKLFERPDRPVGLDDGQAAPLDFDRQTIGLRAKQALLCVEDHVVPLRLDELIDVERGGCQRCPLGRSERCRLVDERSLPLGQNLLRTVAVGQRGTPLIAFCDPEFLERFETEAIFGHELGVGCQVSGVGGQAAEVASCGTLAGVGPLSFVWHCPPSA
jgi:hypothetical protein